MIKMLQTQFDVNPIITATHTSKEHDDDHKIIVLANQEGILFVLDLDLTEHEPGEDPIACLIDSGHSMKTDQMHSEWDLPR